MMIGYEHTSRIGGQSWIPAVTILFFSLLVGMSQTASAWEHYQIPWYFGVSSGQASPTIAVGDTVTWTWADGLPHSVRSTSDVFNSGIFLSNGHTYTFIFTDAGDYPYQCDVHFGSMSGTIKVKAAGFKFVGRAMLEGAYAAAGMMSTALASAIPTTQPYSDAIYDGTPLDYDGTEVVGLFPEGTVDWLLIDLRSDSTEASAIADALRPAFLLEDGLIVGLDGDTLFFDGIEANPYYVVIRHRNHLAIMSADPVVEFVDGFGEWDFTTSDDQAFGSVGNRQKLVDGSGIYAMFASDGNGDGQITAPDFNLWNAATTAGNTGYERSDYNLDTIVTAPDFNLWNANTTAGASSQVPD